MTERHAVKQLTPSGWAILIAALVLTAFGIATIHVTDTVYFSGHDGPSNARKQAAILVLSLGLGWLILRVGYRRIAPWSYALALAATILLIPPVVARLTHQDFGGLIPMRNGAYRWIRLPFFQIQPSEVMKVTMILAVAWYLRYRHNFRSFGGLIKPLAAALVPLVLILLEPDLGMALLILPLVFLMLYVAGAKPRHLGVFLLLGLLLAPLAWSKLESYQRRRITAVLLQSASLRDAIRANPERYAFLADARDVVEWSRGSGYQLIQSKNAIGSGHITGQGWGHGPFVENPFLPDRHNDFIFAVIAHQWGLLGCLVVLGAYGVIIVAGARIACATREPFGRLVAAGVVAVLGVQVFVNVGMTMGLMPITGVTLPLVSYGGCSLLMNMLSLALIVSIAQHRPYLLTRKPFDFDVRTRRVHPMELPAGSGPRTPGPPRNHGPLVHLSPEGRATRAWARRESNPHVP